MRARINKGPVSSELNAHFMYIMKTMKVSTLRSLISNWVSAPGGIAFDCLQVTKNIERGTVDHTRR